MNALNMANAVQNTLSETLMESNEKLDIFEGRINYVTHSHYFQGAVKRCNLRRFLTMDESITNEGMEGTEARTYSQEEVDELLQKEGDRRVSEAQKK